MIYKVWFPLAIKCKIDYNTFWEINPKILKIYAEERIKELQEIRTNNELLAYANGIYVKFAISSSFSKEAEFPKKPIGVLSEQFREDEERELTDEEKERECEKLFMSLQIMKINFDAAKAKEEAEAKAEDQNI